MDKRKYFINKLDFKLIIIIILNNSAFQKHYIIKAL